MSAEADHATAPAAPVVHPVASVVRVALGLLLLGMVVLNVVSALCRYVFGIIFTGADELLVFAMVWMVMVGTIVVTASRSHIALDFLVLRTGPRAQTMLSIFHHASTVVVCGFTTWYCWQFVARVAAIGQTSMALGIPMTIPHLSLVVGFAGTTIVAAALLVKDIAALLRLRAANQVHSA